MFGLIVLLPKARINGLQLWSFVEVFADESAIFDSRKHGFLRIVWVGKTTVVKKRANITFARTLGYFDPFVAAASSRYPTRRSSGLFITAVTLVSSQ